MIPIPSWLVTTLVTGCLSLASLAGAYYKGMTNERAEWEAKIAQQKIEAAEQEADWAKHVADIKVKHEKDKAAVQRNLDTALNSLRDRPTTRLPDTARSSCAGVSGKELARDDARFLAGYAADAARLQADLDACRAYISTVTKKRKD